MEWTVKSIPEIIGEAVDPAQKTATACAQAVFFMPDKFSTCAFLPASRVLVPVPFRVKVFAGQW